jgi:hypothetical protein
LNKLNSRITIFVFAALLLGGFPNFMVQEAHADVQLAAGACVVNLNSNTVTFTFTDGGAGGTTDITSLTITDISLNDGGGAYTLTANSSVEDLSGTDLVITVTLGSLDKYNLNKENAITTCTANNVGSDGTAPNSSNTSDSSPSFTADSTAPTLSSASLDNSAKTLTLTFSEGVSIPTATGYTINGDNGETYTLTGGSVSGSEGSTSYTITYLDADQTEINNMTFDSTSTVTVAGSNVNDGDNNIAGATVSLTTSGIVAYGGGSGCKDCEEPTLGVLSSGQRVVEDGFTYNGHSVDVERFFTPYPLITAQVGKQNTAQFKIYENRGPDNIAHFSFAFGLGKDQIISESKTMIEVDFARDRTQTVTVTDPENALDNVSVTTDKVACNGGPTQCLEITINHMFREPLDFDIVGTDVWDYSRQSWQNYYNHGIEVVGPSMNPPDEFDGIDKGHIYHLTETSKTTAVDEFGDSWTFQYGIWTKDFIKQERIQDGEKMVFDRMHSDFVSYRENLAAAALIQLSETCPLCIEEYSDFDDSTSLEYVDRTSKLSDPQVQMIMSLESQKAQNILKYIMDPKLSSTEKYKTLVELEKDDRPISEILEEERMMKVILQAERAWLKQVIAPNQ